MAIQQIIAVKYFNIATTAMLQKS